MLKALLRAIWVFLPSQVQTVAQLPGPASHTLHVQPNKDSDHLDSAVAIYLQIGPQTHALDASLQVPKG